MARPCACRSPCWNPPPSGKDEHAGAAPGPAPTDDSETPTYTHTMSCILTPAPAPPPALVNSIARYSKKDLQWIFKTVLETTALGLALQPLVFLNGPLTKFLKARFPNLYYSKTHIECYNFCQQCKDHFTIARARGHNQVLFVAIFLQDQDLFQCQQHKRKLDDEIVDPITWNNFNTFFC